MMIFPFCIASATRLLANPLKGKERGAFGSRSKSFEDDMANRHRIFTPSRQAGRLRTAIGRAISALLFSLLFRRLRDSQVVLAAQTPSLAPANPGSVALFSPVASTAILFRCAMSALGSA